MFQDIAFHLCGFGEQNLSRKYKQYIPRTRQRNDYLLHRITVTDETSDKILVLPKQCSDHFFQSLKEKNTTTKQTKKNQHLCADH